MKLKNSVISITLALGLIIGMFSSNSTAETLSPNVFIDGKKIAFEVPPTVVDGSTLVPMRKIFEELGATIDWDNDSRTVTAHKGNIVIKYTIGQQIAKKDADDIVLSVPGVIIDGSTMMPLRFVGEALGSTVGWEGNSRTITISSTTKTKTKVTSVVDGDTVKIDWNGKTESIRLIGVDTPETVHPSKPVQEFGKEASDYTKKELTGATVFVELDVEQRDRYGRLLGYIYTEDGAMFNAKLAAEGYGQVATFPPNVRWVELFKSLQTNARDNTRGLWVSADTTPRGVSIGDIAITSVDAEAEIVVITNNGSTDVSLSGWKLVSVTGDQAYNFPDSFVLKSGASVELVSGPNAKTGTGKLVWTTKYIWNNEEADPAELYDNSGLKVSENK